MSDWPSFWALVGAGCFVVQMALIAALCRGSARVNGRGWLYAGLVVALAPVGILCLAMAGASQ